MQHTFPVTPSSNTAYMQQPNRDGSSLEMSLREHLLAAQAGQQQPPSLQAPHDAMHTAHSASPHEHNIDPAIAGPGFPLSPSGSGGDDHMHDARKGRRELSTSKRAAQNRAAQRAFRQRKEEYIKSLKDQVRDLESLHEDYKAVRAENYQLRDYIINLQSRLLESQGEFPQPPSNIDLSQPPRGAVIAGVDPSMQQMQAPTAPMGAPPMAPSAVSQLQAAAAQAAAASANELSNSNSEKPHHEEAQYLPQKVEGTGGGEPAPLDSPPSPFLQQR